MITTIPIHNYQITSTNKQELRGLLKEVFVQDSYYFETEKTNPVILDIGAHVGVATHYFKKYFPQATIFAVEPHPAAFELLEKNVEQNYLENVVCIQAALTSAGESLTLYVDQDNDWLSTTSTTKGAWNQTQQTEPIQVKGVSLTELIQRVEKETGQNNIDLLKMDIEGAEVEVLQQSKAVLQSIEQIIVEFHPTNKNNLQQFLEFMKKQGFTIDSETNKSVHKKEELQLLYFKK